MSQVTDHEGEVAIALHRIADVLEALTSAYLQVNKIAGRISAFEEMVDAHKSLTARRFIRLRDMYDDE